MVFREATPKRVVELTERRYARPTVSRTFEGRDRFAPAAAWLAKGIDLTALGRPLTAWHVLEVPEALVSDMRIAGEVLRVDRFGNLVTNIDRRTLDRFASGGALDIAAAQHPVTRLVATYAEADAGSICALIGSGDHLEIAVTGGSAAERLHLDRGAPIIVTRR
jgi:S-adenosylmethionine hydrolase